MGARRWPHGRVLSLGVACALLCGPGAGVASAALTTTSFATPGVASFVVPIGVTSIDVTAIGAAGGSATFTCTGVGGRGASVSSTLAVTPGELLLVGVGGVGGAGGCGQPNGGAGGVGGGGAGGNAVPGGGGVAPAAGGGGASSVARLAPSPGFTSLLVVAAGGGGAGGLLGSDGGDAGAAGETIVAVGGGAGTATAGGAGGAPNGACGGAAVGSAGAVGVGGAGALGAGGTNGNGGGGGGGGYYGGGGGGGSCSVSSGAGGGGGSSFVAQGSLTATPTSTSARVTFTYDVPTAALSTQVIVFPETPQGVASSEQLLTVSNPGTAPLTVDGLTLAGTDPGDYLVSDRCGAPVAAGASCVVGIRFLPHAAGASSATLTLVTNAAAQPAAIALSGTGGALPQGPTGPAGPAGAAGPAGPVGPAGPAGLTDSTRPTVALTKLATRPKLSAFRRGLSFTISPSEPVTLDVSLTTATGRVVLVGVERSASAVRSLRLVPNGRLLGRPTRPFKVVLGIVATDAGGNRTRVSRTITVQPDA